MVYERNSELPMKLIAFFQGTDALLISRWDFPCLLRKRFYQIWVRVRTKLLNPFVTEYWAPNSDIAEELRKAGIKKHIRVQKDNVTYPDPFDKKEHEGFNVLYYWPGDGDNKRLWRWIYGYDIYLYAKKILGSAFLQKGLCHGTF